MRAMLLLTVLLFAVPDREDPTPKKDRPKTPEELVLGDWLLETLDGNPRGGPNQPVLVFRVLPTASIFLVNGQPSPDALTADIKIDWSKNPVAIDFMSKPGGKLLGILKVDGDRLILGLTLGDQRPADFAKAPMVAQYKRIKK